MKRHSFISVSKTLLTALLLFILSACASDPANRSQAGAIDAAFKLPIPKSGPLDVDQQFARVAEKIPGFAGAFYDQNGILTAYVKTSDSLELQQLSSTTGALAQVLRKTLDSDILRPSAVPSKQPQLGAQRATPQLRILKADYTFAELASARHGAETLGLFRVPGFVSLDIDERRNRLFVGAENLQAKAEIANHLARAGLEQVSLVEVVRPFENVATLQDKVRPMLGGLQLLWGPYQSSYYVCTMGFVAVRNGVKGFVTNSHCTGNETRITGMKYRQGPDLSSAFVGKEQVEARLTACGANRCRSSDSAFVRFTSGQSQLGKLAYLENYYNPDASIIANYQVTGTANPVVGQYLVKIGRTTGETYGQVIQTNTDILIGNVVNRRSFVVEKPSDIPLMMVAGGDSGSPVISTNASNTNAILRGLLYGGTADGALFAASPFSQVVGSLGTLRVR